jgi:hypothetical protein
LTACKRPYTANLGRCSAPYLVLALGEALIQKSSDILKRRPAHNPIPGRNAHPALRPVKGVNQEPHLLAHPGRIALLVLLWAIMAAALYSDLPAHSVAPLVLPTNPDNAAPYAWQTVLYAVLNGLGQIVGQANPITGALMLARILVNSRFGGLMAQSSAMCPRDEGQWTRLQSGEVMEGGRWLHEEYEPPGKGPTWLQVL